MLTPLWPDPAQQDALNNLRQSRTRYTTSCVQTRLDARLGTPAFPLGFSAMSEPLPWLIERSIQIAWDYLERAGEIADAAEASRFLQKAVDEMVMKGERRALMLANRAIEAYRHRDLQLASWRNAWKSRPRNSSTS